MITLSTLEQKLENNSFNNEEYIGDLEYPKIDLRSQLWRINFNAIIIADWIQIDKFTQMRIDTLAKYVYGDESFADVLFKFNRMRNSFEMKEGDVLAIPQLDSFMANATQYNYKSKNITSQVTDDNNNIIQNKTHTVKRNDINSRSYTKSNNGILVFKK